MVCHSDITPAAEGLTRLRRRPAAAALAGAQRRGLGRPDVVLMSSRALATRIGEQTTGAVVTLGVDLADFTGARADPAVRAALALPGAPLLLYAGRLSSEKRIDLLPPMLAALNGRCVLAVAGAGAAERALRRRAERLGVAGRLRLLGSRPGPGLAGPPDGDGRRLRAPQPDRALRAGPARGPRRRLPRGRPRGRGVA